MFSAPEYPQFVGEESERLHNRAAVAVLRAPDYAAPAFVQYDADLPRPEVRKLPPAQCFFPCLAKGKH